MPLQENLCILLTLTLLPTLQAQTPLQNPDFESTPFLTGWSVTGSPAPAPAIAPGTSTTGVHFTTSAQSISQQVAWGADWFIDTFLAVRDTPSRAFSLLVATAAGTTVNLRYQAGSFRTFSAGSWGAPLGIGALEPSIDADNNGSLDDPGDTKNVYRLRLTGTGWGTSNASYVLAVSDANSTSFTRTATNITRYQNGSGTTATPTTLHFSTEFGGNPGFWIDDVSTHDTDVPTPTVHWFVASRENLTVPRQNVVLTWSAENATTLTLDPGKLDVTGTTRAIVTPSTTTRYTLTADATASRSFTIAVSHDPQTLTITELQADNKTTLADSDGDHPDWIEIHNPNAYSTNLAGYFLTTSSDLSNGWDFPQTTLDPGAYLVVFASGKNRATPNTEHHTDFRLSDQGEFLALVDNGVALSDSYDPKFPPLPADISYGHQGYFTNPTPGAPNTPAPYIAAQSHTVAPGGAVTVTATVPSADNPAVTLHLRPRFDPEQPLPMTPGPDNTYAHTIPAGTVAPGEMLRWRITATDPTGTAKLPAFDNPNDSPEYFGTVPVDPDITTNLPVLHWFIEPSQASRADSRAGTRCSIFYNGAFYDNIFVHLRGATTASLRKKPHQFEFNDGFDFAIDETHPPVDQININAAYPDASYIRDVLPNQDLALAGVPVSETFPLRVQQNGEFHSLGIFVEQLDRGFLKHHKRLDPDGPLFKATGNGSWLAGTSGFESRNNSSLSDLSTFTQGIAPNNPNRAAFLFDHVDLPLLVNYLAANNIGSIYNPQKNYYMHRNRHGLWHPLPWDRDFSYGHRWPGASDPRFPTSGPQPTLVADERIEWGASDHDHKGGYNRLFDAAFAVPEIRAMVYRRQRTLIDHILAADAPLTLEQRIATLRAKIADDADLDRAKWGFQTSGSYSNFPQEPFDAALDRILTNYLPGRRSFLENDGGTPARGTLPPSQNTHPAITFGLIDVDPASGNQAHELIELQNPTPTAADLSRWQLTGGVTHTLHPGTVIPANSSLYLTPDIHAFRTRTQSPKPGGSHFVQGNLNGHLSNFGETLTLTAPDGTPVATTTTPVQPTPLQQHLRISEIMYHPADDPDAEFIELHNTSPTETLNLTGATFTNGISYTFPEITTLPPDTYLVIPFAEFTNGRLSNNGETIKLDDASGNTITDFTYSDTAPWPTTPDGTGPSLVHIAGDPDDPQNWRPSTTPGGNPNTSDTVPYSGNGPVAYALSNPPTFDPATFTLTAPRTPASDDALLIPQYSTDLKTWHPNSFDYTGNNTWQLITPPTVIPELFLRFEIQIQ